MRTFLRRLLLGPFIPMMWVICFPLFWLLSGSKMAARVINDLSGFIWNGDEL